MREKWRDLSSPIQCLGTCFPNLTNKEECHSGQQKADGAVNSRTFFPGHPLFFPFPHAFFS